MSGQLIVKSIDCENTVAVQDTDQRGYSAIVVRQGIVIGGYHISGCDFDVRLPFNADEQAAFNALMDGVEARLQSMLQGQDGRS